MRLRVAVALVALFCAGSALAGPMMQAGPAPESSFTGTWRFIGAQPAPWAPRRKLSKTDAPLLEYAIKLKNGAVEGPPPLSCKDARYTEGISTHDELFSGRLNGDKDFALARKIGLSQGEIDTERVICNGKVFDFYFTDNAQFVLGIGDVIYTLEQPTGMEPDQYKGFSGPGFDCTKASATLDRLICMDAELSKSDRRLNANYRALKESESPQSFATFQAAQRAWLAYVKKTCRADVPFPDFVGDRNMIVDCLQGAYEDRADLFDGLRGPRAGALTLEPRMRFRVHDRVEESDVYPFMSGGPRAAAFNAFIAGTLKLDKWRMDDPDVIPPDDDGGDIQLYTRRSYGVARFDGRIVSFQVSTDDFAGSHDAREVAGYTWDIAKARPVTLADVFAPGANWKKVLIPYCRKSLHDQFEDRGGSEPDTAEIAATLGDAGSWQWRTTKAIAVFWVASMGGAPGGEFDVDIPYKMLKPYMKPDAPVLP